MKGSLNSLVLASIGMALAGTVAHAGPLTRLFERSAQENAPLPVQYRDADVFYDGQGNRILMDRETGEIISVRPVRPERRRPMRRQPQDDGFFSDEPEVGEYPAEPEYREVEPGSGEAFPPVPRQPQQPDVARETQPAKPKAIERKPLPTPSTKPASSEDTTTTAKRPADEPIFTQPGQQQQTATRRVQARR